MNFFTKKTKSWTEYLDHACATDITPVGERVKELLAFMGINQDTLAKIKEAAHILYPYKSEMITQFYESITSVEHLQKIIVQNSTIDRLRKTMETYLEQFLQAEVNQDYVMTRIIIGQVHSRIHLTAEHFITAHQLLIQIMTAVLMGKLHHKPDRMIQAVLAVQKLATFDQQLIVEVYMEETFKSFLFGISDMLNHMTQLDTTGQLIRGMEQQIEESHSVSSATEEMTASILEVANHAVKVAEGTDAAVQSAEQSKRVINKALNEIQQVGLVYDEVLNQVNGLNQEIGHTQEVIKIIKEIADQIKIARQTAKIVFELSRQMEAYRSSFFSINVKLNFKDTIRIAQTDHLLWKWKIYKMLLGLETIHSEQVASHENCRLGKWYYGELPDRIKNHSAFHQLEEPHKAVHHYALLAVERHEAGDKASAQEAFEHLQTASDLVVKLLTQLESEL